MNISNKGEEHMNELIIKIKQEYPLMYLVEDEANCSNSIKFARFGITDMDVYVAIRCGKEIEIYDTHGNFKQII